MNDYMYNKEPKDSKLCKLIRKTITVNRKKLGLEFQDVANELGLSAGTLSNKLKPSMMHSDITLTEFIHFLELTDSFEALRHIVNKFDFTLVKNHVSDKSSNFDHLIDELNIENGELFKVAKEALYDDEIDNEEKLLIENALEDVIIAANDLKSQLKGA
ncbi:MAG: hypothetical protein QM497_04830 [Sulfurimonas sp.]